MHLEEVGNIDLKIKSVKDKGNKVIVTFSNDEKLKISKETYLEFNICEDSFLTKSELKEISSSQKFPFPNLYVIFDCVLEPVPVPLNRF